MSKELLDPKEIRICTDASAAVGALHRHGSGKVKHLQIRQLWLQEVVRSKEATIKKVPRIVNYSDLLTHHCNESEGEAHLRGMNAIRRGPYECSVSEGGSKK